MKKFIALFLILISTFCYFGCDGNDNRGENDQGRKSSQNGTYINSQSGIAIMPYSEKEIDRYEYFKLPLYTEEKNIKWSSSDESVALVDKSGTVFGINGGVSIITANVAGENYYCKIAVIDKGYIPSINVDLVFEEIQLNVGDTYTVRPYLCYNQKVFDDALFSFVSDNESVFSVDVSGKITAQGEGETFLRINAQWRNCSDIFEKIIVINVN